MSSSSEETTKMKYVRLGESGLKVSQLILGCMTFGSPDWQRWVLDEEASFPIIKAAYDLGIQTFDTADMYSNGESERILGKAIEHYGWDRESLVIMTKSFNLVQRSPGDQMGLKREEAERKGYVNQQGNSRKHIFAAVDASLARLRLDYIDLLQLHRFDNETPIAETMQALHDVVKSGKVRYVGMSSCFAYQFHAMQNYAITNGLTPFISMQNFHNAIYREEEREMFPVCKLFGTGIIPWSPLARGALTRPVGEATKRSETDVGFKSRNLHQPEPSSTDIISAVEAIAKERGVSMAQVAVAWSIAQPGVSAPVVGSTTAAHLADLVAGASLQLTPDELDAISSPYKPRPFVI